MFRTARPYLAVATAAALAVSVGACSADSGGDDSATLRMGMILEPRSFAAAEANWANESPYMQAVYDTLLEAAPDGTIGPGLAEEFSWDESRTTLTLDLRSGVTFTDGSDFTADVAVQNLERFKAGTSPNASYLSGMDAATVVDDDTVSITLVAPDPAFTTYLSQNAGLQESADAFDNPDVATVPVGSGPYILDTEATVPGSSYVFTKNPDHWNPDRQFYDRVVMNVYGNQTTILNAIRGGEVDVTSLAEVATDDEVEAAGWTLNAQLSETWNGLLLADREGALSPELADVRVRQAINYALDREGLLTAITNGTGVTTTQIFPPTSPSYDESLDDAYPYDPDKARELLAEAGFGEGLSLSMPEIDVVQPSVYTLISQQLGDVGITVVPTAVPIGQALGDLIAAKYPAFYFQLQEDPTDYQIAQFSLAESATWNPFKTADPEVAAFISQIQTGSEEEAAAAGRSLNEYIVEQAWFAPFFRPAFSYASNADTEVTMQVGGAAPYLWNIKPKGR